MNFQPELAAKVMAGEKTVTRRLVSENPRSPWWRERCSLKVDHTYAVCPGRGKHQLGRVRIVSVRREPLGWLAAGEELLEGFATTYAFQEAWKAINGTYDPKALVWRVEFEVSDHVRGRQDHEDGDDERQHRDDPRQGVHGLLRLPDLGGAIEGELRRLDDGRMAGAGVAEGHEPDPTPLAALL